MTTTRDINLGTVIPIALFLIVQTGGGIWWAATTTAQMGALAEGVKTSQADASKRMDDLELGRSEDRRRIFDRLVGVERTVTDVMTQETATRALLSGLEAQIEAMREDVKTNNALLRDLLLNLSNTGDAR